MAKHTKANIKTIFNLATPQEKRDGVVWYANAQRDAQQIAVKNDVPLHIVVGVIAALSPNNKWDRNVINAAELVAAFINGDPMETVKVSTYHTMKAKAWSILQEMGNNLETIAILNGQKIIAFYHCILGRNDCCIDGHARNIAYAERVGLTDDKTNIGVKEYRTLQEAYRQVATQLSRVGRKYAAYEIQAITWVVWRRVHNIK